MSAVCRQSALRFLKIRPRSVHELRSKLQGKGFEGQDIDEVIAWLESVKLIDDRSFTRSWIQYRLARPFGFRRIIAELKEKGVEAGIIEEEIAAVKPDTDESMTALELARRKALRLAGVDPVRKKKRIFDFLVRRGFSPDVIFKTLKQL